MRIDEDQHPCEVAILFGHNPPGVSEESEEYRRGFNAAMGYAALVAYEAHA